MMVLCASSGWSQPPTVQDCLGAIPVCNPVYTTIQSYVGHGNVYPEIHDNSQCPLCMDGEKNDVFYVITVQTDGLLRFVLTPNNPQNDYDWAVFNMTNAECSQLYPEATSLQVSCNSWGVVGTNGPTGVSNLMGGSTNCNGPGQVGSKFNKDIPVNAGETYLINISNWSSTNQSGYTLDFSSSTAAILDNVAPYIDSIQQEILCAGTSCLYFKFSENVLCTDVNHHPEKFTLTGPAGTYTITDVTSVSCATGGTQGKTFQLNVSPLAFEGNYQLNIVGMIRDLCMNTAPYQAYPFNLMETNSPQVNAGSDVSISYGAYTQLNGTATGGSGNFSYHWEPANLLVNPNILDPTTVSMTQSTVFTFTAMDMSPGGCSDSDQVLVTVLGGPLAVSASATPNSICVGESTQLNALASGGSGSYTYSWTSNPPGFTSNLQSPVVEPDQNTTYHVQVGDGYVTVNTSTTVHVYERPLPDAGLDVSIPYGTTTTLHGNASGGSGSYSFLWSSVPPGFSSTDQNPLTPQLEITTLFKLTVTDLLTGCISQDPDLVTVTVTGSPLNVNPVAIPPQVCRGNSSTLNALAGGGAGNYSYSWTSTPAGFTSSQSDPVVTPLVTTTYHVSVNDGYNQVSGDVVVTSDPLPQINLGPADTTICIYDTLTLDAGNPGASFLWSNGAVEQQIRVGTSGLGFETSTYSVRVTSQTGCIDSASITVVFSYSACVGEDEMKTLPAIIIFPNPARNSLMVLRSNPAETASYTIFNLWGSKISEGMLTAPREHVNVSLFPKGVYILQITHQNQSDHIQFIKE